MSENQDPFFLQIEKFLSEIGENCGADMKQKDGYSSSSFFFFWLLFSCCCGHQDITEFSTPRFITATELGQ